MMELKVHASACHTEPMVHLDKMRAEFVARLKKALASAGIDEWGAGIRLAKAAGVTPKAVSKWMNRETMPSRARMAKISEDLGVRVEWLEYGKGAMRESEAEKASSDISDLLNAVTPKTRKVLERIQQLESSGSLDDRDIDALNAIIERFSQRE